MLVGQPQFGISLNPLHYAKKGVKAVGKGAVAVGKGAYTVGKYGAKGAVAVAKNPYVQAGVSSFVPGGAAAVAATKLLPGGGGGGAPAAAPEPGVTDLTPIQDQAAQAAQPEAAAAPAGPGMVMLPGVGAVKRSHLMIGGGILAAVVLLSLLRK